MAAILRAYARALETNPITTKAVSAGVLMMSGDVIAQKLEGKTLATWDSLRTGALDSKYPNGLEYSY